MLSRLFVAALRSPDGKWLTSWLLFVMFIVILLLSHLESWDRCGTWLYRFLILAVFLTLRPRWNAAEIMTCDPSVYTMDHPDFIVCSFIGISIVLKRINKSMNLQKFTIPSVSSLTNQPSAIDCIFFIPSPSPRTTPHLSLRYLSSSSRFVSGLKRKDSLKLPGCRIPRIS